MADPVRLNAGAVPPMRTKKSRVFPFVGGTVLGSLIAGVILYFGGVDRNTLRVKAEYDAYKKTVQQNYEKESETEAKRRLEVLKDKDPIYQFAKQGYDCEQARVDSLANQRARRIADGIIAEARKSLKAPSKGINGPYTVSQLADFVRGYNVDPNGDNLVVPGTDKRFGDFMADAILNGKYFDFYPDEARIASIAGKATVDGYDIFNISQSIMPLYNWASEKNSGKDISDITNAAYSGMIEGLTKGESQGIRFQYNK